MDAEIILRLFAGMEERVTRLEERERAYDARLRALEEREREVRDRVAVVEARERQAPAAAGARPGVVAPSPGGAAPAPPAPYVEPDERARIVAALEQTRWNKRKAAELLGMPRRTLYRRLHEHGLLTDDRNPRPSSS